MRRRYELTDQQYERIEPLLSGKPGDPGRNAEDNRRFMNAVYWIARTGAPWADLPERFGKYDTVYQRFNRWAKKERWKAIFEALQEPDLDWVMIDSSVVRAHQHAAGQKSSAEAEVLGRSRGGFSTKINVARDALGNPLQIVLTPGQTGDCPQAEPLLRAILPDSVLKTGAELPPNEGLPRIGAVLGDKGYDSNDLLAYVASLEAEAVIPSKKNRNEQREIDRELYKDRNKIERFIGWIKHYRRVATRYEKTARNYLAMLHLRLSDGVASVGVKRTFHLSARPSKSLM
jgi:transposase